MGDSELSDGVKNIICIILILLSALVLLVRRILYQLSLLTGTEPGILNEVAAVIGWVVLGSAVVYVLADLRKYLPVVDLTDEH